MFKTKSIKKIIVLIIFWQLLPNVFIDTVSAQSIDELKQNIENHNNKIKQLEEEIKVYEKQIETTSSQAATLQSAIKVLDTNQKKIGTEIKKTETNIQKTNLTILELSDDIENIQEKIISNTKAISKTLNDINQIDDQSLIEEFLSDQSIADIFDKYESIRKFQEKVGEQSDILESQKQELANKKAVNEKEKNKLVSLKTDLNDQNYVLTTNKKEKNTLLTTTKNQEAEYKKMLAERQAEKERFEKELYEYESQLKLVIDPKSYPASGRGILSWPIDNVFITQYFGKTADSKRLYSSGTHNGVDFRASIGIPIKAALDGTVVGTGNTDEQRGCYSYGKWILIEHNNGLSTLYAHLSLIKVSSGQKVNTGDLIAYSGNTGYSTGPHLHLTVYATQGLAGIQKYSSSKNCKNVNIPIADVRAYLDPMLYLPKI